MHYYIALLYCIIILHYYIALLYCIIILHYYIALLNLKCTIKILNKLIIIYNKTNVLTIRINFSNNVFNFLKIMLLL